MIPLTTVDPCVGCGACCLHIGLPPFEVPNPDLGPIPRQPARTWHEQAIEQDLLDTELFLMMPAELRAEHARMVQEIESDPQGSPCAWLDLETKKCKHYEWRPAVCRDWEPGCVGCNAARHRGNQVWWRGSVAVDAWWNPKLPEREEPGPRVDGHLTGCTGEWRPDREWPLLDAVRWVARQLRWWKWHEGDVTQRG